MLYVQQNRNAQVIVEFPCIEDLYNMSEDHLTKEGYFLPASTQVCQPGTWSA